MLSAPVLPLLAAILTLGLTLGSLGQQLLPQGCAWVRSTSLSLPAGLTLANCTTITVPAYAINVSADNDGWVPRGREPAQWLPAEMRPSPPATFLLLADLTLLLPSCNVLWDLAAQECTFSPSAHWPSSGVQAGPGYLFYRRQTGLFSTAERVNLTCPPAEWESLLAAASPPLAPCGTAIVTTGEQLLQALEQLQPAHARVLVTLDANISLPTEPTPQRGIATNHDVIPLVKLYRNVTLAGGGPRLSSGGTTELDVRLRRNAFDLSTDAMYPLGPSDSASTGPTESPPVLSLADLHVVNAPQGPPDSLPLGLMTGWFYYVTLDRLNLQILLLRVVSVATPAEVGYVLFWINQMRSRTAEEASSADWLRRIMAPNTQVRDAEGRLIRYGAQRNPDGVEMVAGYNISTRSRPLLTIPSTLDFTMFSLPDSRMPPPSSVAMASNTMQLLMLLQEPWTDGWRVIMLTRNMTLSPDWWPKDGAALSYNVTLVGPAAGDPVCLDLGGMQLARSIGADRAMVSCQFLQLWLVGMSPLLLVISRQVEQLSSIRQGGTWTERCLPVANTSGMTVEYEFHYCHVELSQGSLDIIGAYNSPAIACTGSHARGAAVAAVCGMMAENTATYHSEATVQLLRTVLLVDGKAVYHSYTDDVGSISSISFVDTATLGGLQLANTTAVPCGGTHCAVPRAPSHVTVGISNSYTLAYHSQCDPAELLTEVLTNKDLQPQSTSPPSYSPPWTTLIVPSDSGHGASVAGIIGGTLGGAVALLLACGCLLLWVMVGRRHSADDRASKHGPTRDLEQSLPVVAVMTASSCSTGDAMKAAHSQRMALDGGMPGMPGGIEAGIGSHPSDSFIQGPVYSSTQKMATLLIRSKHVAAGTSETVETPNSKRPVSGTMPLSASGGPRSALQAGMVGEIEAMISMCSKTTSAADSGHGRSRSRPRLLGRGAHGSVYLGEWRTLPVAIKVMIFQAGDSAGRRERIAREVALTTTLENPFVVPTYRFLLDTIRMDGGTSGGGIGSMPLEKLEENVQEVDEDGEDVAALRLRLIMQYCEGGTLSSALQRGMFAGAGAGAALRTEALPQQALASLAQPPTVPLLVTPAETTIPVMLAPFSVPPKQLSPEGACNSRDDDSGPWNRGGSLLLVSTAGSPQPQAQLLRGGCNEPYAAAAGVAAAIPRSGQAPAASRMICSWVDLTPAVNLPLALLAALDVARGLAYLHDRSVIHGDLNDNNILLKAVQPQIAQYSSAAQHSAAVQRLRGACLEQHVPQQQAGRLSADDPGGSGCLVAVATGTNAAPAAEEARFSAGRGSVEEQHQHEDNSSPGMGQASQAPQASSAASSPIGGRGAAGCSGGPAVSAGVAGAVQQLEPQPGVTAGKVVTAGGLPPSSSPEAVAELLLYTFKIADFGLAVQLHDPSQTHVSNLAHGTPFFAAPEVMEAGHMSPAADIYSFGVVLWLLCHGVSMGQIRHLLPRMHHIPIASLLLSHASSSLPHRAHDLLQSCLDLQPSLRPRASDLQRRVEELLKVVAGPELEGHLLTVERKEHISL